MGNSRYTGILFLLLCCLTFAAADSVRGRSLLETNAPDIDELIPTSLVMPAGNKVQQLLLGVGYQIYNYNGTAWVNVNVSADLYNFKGEKVGHHFFLAQRDANGGQPSWETFRPASVVTAKAVAMVAQEDSIAWVLLQATNNSGSKKFMGSTTYVQRLYTQHGLPPNAAYPALEGDMFISNYTAVYALSKATQTSE